MSSILLVASAGGHLQQLHMLADRLATSRPRVWVTFDTPQARSLLRGEVVEYVPYVSPRGYRDLLACLPSVPRIHRRHDVSAMVSTGSGVALAFLPYGAVRGVPSYYIESATRADGPSFTGRLLARVPRVQVCTQWQHWADERWRYVGSVFDGFVGEEAAAPGTTVRRVVVSCGTIRPYGFRRLVDRLVEILPPSVEVLWQTGATDVSGLGIDAVAELDAAAMTAAIEDADVVIAHAGTGIALATIEAGKCPVLVPRRVAHGEHIDDHQLQTARVLVERGLAVSVEVDDLVVDHLVTAFHRQVRQATTPPALALDLPA